MSLLFFLLKMIFFNLIFQLSISVPSSPQKHSCSYLSYSIRLEQIDLHPEVKHPDDVVTAMYQQSSAIVVKCQAVNRDVLQFRVKDSLVDSPVSFPPYNNPISQLVYKAMIALN